MKKISHGIYSKSPIGYFLEQTIGDFYDDDHQDMATPSVPQSSSDTSSSVSMPWINVK